MQVQMESPSFKMRVLVRHFHRHIRPVIGQAGAGIFAEENTLAGVGIIIDGSGKRNQASLAAPTTAFLAEILNPADSGIILVDQTGVISSSHDGHSHDHIRWKLHCDRDHGREREVHQRQRILWNLGDIIRNGKPFRHHQNR